MDESAHVQCPLSSLAVAFDSAIIPVRSKMRFTRRGDLLGTIDSIGDHRRRDMISLEVQLPAASAGQLQGLRGGR